MEFSLSDPIKEWVDRNKEGIANRSVDRVEMAKYVKELCKERIDQLKGLTGQAADPQLLQDREYSAEMVLYYHAWYSTTDNAICKSMFLQWYDHWNTELNETITEYCPIFKTLEKARAEVGSSSSDGELGHDLNSIFESFEDDVAANHDYLHVQLLYNNYGMYSSTWPPIIIEKKLPERSFCPSLIASILNEGDLVYGKNKGIGPHYTTFSCQMKKQKNCNIIFELPSLESESRISQPLCLSRNELAADHGVGILFAPPGGIPSPGSSIMADLVYDKNKGIGPDYYTFNRDKMKTDAEDLRMEAFGRHGKMTSKNELLDYVREHGATIRAYYSDGGPGHGPNHVSPVIIELKKLAELGESAADANVGPTEVLGHDPNYTTEEFIDNAWEESNAVKIIEGAHANLGTSGVPIALPLTTEFQENTTNEYGGSNVPDQMTIIDMPANNDNINATPAEPEGVGNYLMTTSQTNVLLGISAPFVALTNNISDSDSPHAMTLLVIAAALGVLFIVLGCILRGKRPTWSIRMTNAAVIINATAIIFSMLLHVGLVMALIGGSLAFFIIAAAMLFV